jgi:hypothetical protein
MKWFCYSLWQRKTEVADGSPKTGAIDSCTLVYGQTCKKTDVAAQSRKVMSSPRIGSSGENPSASKTSFVPSTPSLDLR